jgi:DNA-binding MarR family transcriptional regulator
MCRTGRITMKELSAMLSLSPPAAAERVRRLEQNGIITGLKRSWTDPSSDSRYRFYRARHPGLKV